VIRWSRREVELRARHGPPTADLGWLFCYHGHLTEGRAPIERILQATGGVDIYLRSRVLFQAGMSAWGAGEWDEARARLKQSLVLFRRQGDAGREATATAFIGHVD
jgi:hypothetical protein